MKNLKKISHYARDNSVSVAYIYKLIEEGKIIPERIDEVYFINTKKYPSIKELKKQ